MKVFVTGVCGQLGHDVVNELISRGHEAVGSDITDKYEGADDGSAVVTAPYEQLDITDGESVRTKLTSVNPDAVMRVVGDYVKDNTGAKIVWHNTNKKAKK